MNTVAVDEFFSKIAPMAETCPPFVVRSAVVNTVADICKQTALLTARATLTTKKDEYEYRIPTQTDLVPLFVRGAYCDGQRIEPIHYDELELVYGAGDPANAKGRPCFFANRRPDWLLLSPCPDKEYQIDLDLALSTSRAPTIKSIPDVFFNYYLDTVVFGSLARIYRVAGQASTNVRLADEYDMLVVAGLKEIKHDASREFTRSSGHIPFRRII